MSNSRPMSEHEGALFDALLAIAATVLEMGADPEKLKARLAECRAAADALGNRHGVETLDFMTDSLFKPTEPPTKPAFRIV
jgi:hypothetical protein